MITVELLDKFNTSVGNIICVKTNKILKINTVVVANGEKYLIKKILMPTRSYAKDELSLVVNKLY